MELTVDQALQQGVKAHQEGKLQDAERLYRAILQAQPKHPDANHNLAVLAVSIGKPLEALPLFKLALEANSQTEQFWLSYIDALITVERFDEAKHVLIEGEKSGVSVERLDALKQRLEGRVLNDPNKTAKDQAPSEKRKAQGSSSSAAPSQDQIKRGVEHYQAGRSEEAEALATSLTDQFPEHPFGWMILGAVYKQTGRLGESLAPIQKSVELSPQDADAHYNLGVTFKDLGRLDEAEASYKQAIALKAHYFAAHNNLGNTLQELGRLNEAENSYRQAIALRPDYAKAHNNLGVVLEGQGSLGRAEASYRRAIALKSDYAEAHNNLGNTLKDLGRLDEAQDSYREAIALKPDYVEAHNNLGSVLQERGKLAEAENSYRQAILLKPDTGLAAHMLSALTGVTTKHAPLDYVENLFDKHAENFDSTLVENLGYRMPKYVAEMMIRHQPNNTMGSVLDLGCGTGLFGVEIAQFCDRMEGVDLSANMLVKAGDRGIYDKLHKQDITSYLSEETLSFDYFVATDVFIYLGALNDVFELVRSRNQSHGNLVFSTEHMDGDGYELRSSGRYAHSQKYIEALCQEYGYQVNHFETQSLRLEKGDYLRGGLYLLSF